MRYDEGKIENAVLALLGALEFENGRVWKRYSFDVMDSLHTKGYITDPRGRQESVYLTEQGLQLAKRLADDLFGLPGAPERGPSHKPRRPADT
jgi:acyl-CoA hydrolase